MPNIMNEEHNSIPRSVFSVMHRSKQDETTGSGERTPHQQKPFHGSDLDGAGNIKRESRMRTRGRSMDHSEIDDIL